MTTAKDSKRAAAAALIGAAARQVGNLAPAVLPAKPEVINLLAVSAALLVGVGIGASEPVPQGGAVIRLDLEGEEQEKGRSQEDDYDCSL